MRVTVHQKFTLIHGSKPCLNDKVRIFTFNCTINVIVGCRLIGLYMWFAICCASFQKLGDRDNFQYSMRIMLLWSWSGALYHQDEEISVVYPQCSNLLSSYVKSQKYIYYEHHILSMMTTLQPRCWLPKTSLIIYI